MPRLKPCFAMIGICAAVSLAACSAPGDRDRDRDCRVDPAVAAALAAPLLTDPDLAAQNAQFAAIAADPFAPDPVGKNAR